MSKHCGVNRQQKAHGNLYLAFSPLLCVMGVPTKVLLDYMHRMLAGEFLRRLNIWLDHQSDNGFLAESKDEVDVALLNVKFPHDFNRKLRPIIELKRWKDRELKNFFLHVSLPLLKLFCLTITFVILNMPPDTAFELRV